MKLRDLTTLEEINLPNDLLWENELNWSAMASTNTYSLTGALIVEQGVRQSGRPIHLAAPEPDMAWVSKEVAKKLVAWSAIPDRKFQLRLEYTTDVRAFIVIFDNTQDGPVTAEPVKGFPQHADDDWFRVSIKLLEVTP